MSDSVLIIGPPRGGKTTLGRFLSSHFSNSSAISVGDYYRKFESSQEKERLGQEEQFKNYFKKVLVDILQSEKGKLLFVDGCSNLEKTMWICETFKSLEINIFSILYRDNTNTPRYHDRRRERFDDSPEKIRARLKNWEQSSISIFHFFMANYPAIYRVVGEVDPCYQGRKPRIDWINKKMIFLSEEKWNTNFPFKAKPRLRFIELLIPSDHVTFGGRLAPIESLQEYSRVMDECQRSLGRKTFEPTYISSVLSSDDNLEFVFSNNYLISPKCDGVRFLMFFFPQITTERIYFLDRKKMLHVAASPDQFFLTKPVILDVEIVYLPESRAAIVIGFDILVDGTDLLWMRPFCSRLERLESLGWSGHFPLLTPKTPPEKLIMFSKTWTPVSIESFMACSSNDHQYPVDGAVFYDANRSYHFGSDRHLFKYQSSSQLRYEERPNRREDDFFTSFAIKNLVEKRFDLPFIKSFGLVDDRKQKNWRSALWKCKGYRFDKNTPNSTEVIADIKRTANFPLVEGGPNAIVDKVLSLSLSNPISLPSLDSELVHPVLRMPFMKLERLTKKLLAKEEIGSYTDPQTKLEVFCYRSDRPPSEQARIFRGIVLDFVEQKVVALSFTHFQMNERIEKNASFFPSCQDDNDRRRSINRYHFSRDDDIALQNVLSEFSNISMKEKDEDEDETKQPVRLTEKYDGSLVMIFRWKGELKACTKRRFGSEQALWALSWISRELSINQVSLLVSGYTYLFETIYPQNEIVIKYEYTGLVLLSVFDNKGREWSYSRTASLGYALNVKVPDQFICQEKFVKMYVDFETTSSKYLYGGDDRKRLTAEGFVVEKYNMKANGSSSSSSGRDGFSKRVKIVYPKYDDISQKLKLIHPFSVWQMIRYFRLSSILEKSLRQETEKGFHELTRMKKALLSQWDQVWQSMKIDILPPPPTLGAATSPVVPPLWPEEDEDDDEDQSIYEDCDCNCSLLIGSLGRCTCKCHETSLLSFLVDCWSQRMPKSPNDTSALLRTLTKRLYALSLPEKKHLFHQIEYFRETFNDHSSLNRPEMMIPEMMIPEMMIPEMMTPGRYEAICIFQMVCDSIAPMETFPRPPYPPEMSIIPGYTPSARFQQTYCKGWGDSAKIETMKISQASLGILDLLPDEIVELIFEKWIGRKAMFQYGAAFTSKYWYYITSSLFFEGLKTEREFFKYRSDPPETDDYDSYGEIYGFSDYGYFSP